MAKLVPLDSCECKEKLLKFKQLGSLYVHYTKFGSAYPICAVWVDVPLRSYLIGCHYSIRHLIFHLFIRTGCVFGLFSSSKHGKSLVRNDLSKEIVRPYFLSQYDYPSLYSLKKEVTAVHWIME